MRQVDDGDTESDIQVDVARLLLILRRFASPVPSEGHREEFWPARPVVARFSAEYRLHKLDFLLRYPAYLAYELIELHREGKENSRDPLEVAEVVTAIIQAREPELMTQHFRKFWHGAFENIDLIEAWWHAHEFVFVGKQQRGDQNPIKHYFLTALACETADRLVAEVPEVRWYSDRIALIHHFYADIPAGELVWRQYQHEQYRDAPLNRWIPNLPVGRVLEHARSVLGLNLEVSYDS